MSLARILSMGRNGESTKEMMGRPLEILSFVLPECSRMGVDGQSPLPRDRLCHVGVEGTRQVRTQWRMVRLVAAQKLTGLERCFRWIGSKNTD